MIPRKHKKHIRMLTDGTSDTVNLILGSAPGDTIPDMQQIAPLIQELSGKEEVIALILFGSVARGQARSISDIDLCIVTPRDLPQSGRWDLLSYGSQMIDLNLFWDLPVTIRFRAIREGRVLFCKDTLLFHRIKVDTVREYFDVAPLVRRHCLHAIGTRV
ncbi:MAG: nucleotidyltransferase domain-containing protein [Methanoregula sp.]|nr:nucleotidyltransferase domain-containing protein [Methanoregula sp.]